MLSNALDKSVSLVCSYDKIKPKHKKPPTNYGPTKIPYRETTHAKFLQKWSKDIATLSSFI